MWQYVLGSLIIGIGLGVGTTLFILYRQKKKLIKKAQETLKQLNLTGGKDDTKPKEKPKPKRKPGRDKETKPRTDTGTSKSKDTSTDKNTFEGKRGDELSIDSSIIRD